MAERLEEIEQQIKEDPVSAQLVLDSISQYPFHDPETEAKFLLYDIFCKYRLDLEEPDDTRISKAERVIMKSGTQHQKMLVLFLHAYILKNAKQYYQSMMKFKESLVAGENSSDHYLLGQIYTQMSFLCIPNMDIDQLQFAEKALNEYRLLQDSILILDGETNIAIMNFNRHRYELCLDLFGQLAVKSERMGDTLCLGKSLILLSECELKFGKYTSALNHLKKVQSLKTFTYTSHTPTLLAMAYAGVGEKDSAIYYLDEASVQANTLSALNTYQEYASKVYTIMEDYKQAFDVYQQLHNRLDSMYAETINRSVMKAQKDFAEKRIGFFEREVRMKNFFSAFLIFVLVAGCAFFIYYRNQQRRILKLQDDNQKNVLRGMILSTVVTRLKQMASEETIPSESDWNDLNQLFEEMLPSFERKLRQKNSLSEIEWRICQLEKLGFSNKEVATLICKAKNTISTANAKLFKQRFGVDGGSSGWLDFIQKL
ncbi:MAG: hypothetical protein J6W47_08620 [Bacteroidales bacterium]|nr:hypothetical protein [Bacteroidales bacterium]